MHARNYLQSCLNGASNEYDQNGQEHFKIKIKKKVLVEFKKQQI